MAILKSICRPVCPTWKRASASAPPIVSVLRLTLILRQGPASCWATSAWEARLTAAFLTRRLWWHELLWAYLYLEAVDLSGLNGNRRWKLEKRTYLIVVVINEIHGDCSHRGITPKVARLLPAHCIVISSATYQYPSRPRISTLQHTAISLSICLRKRSYREY